MRNGPTEQMARAPASMEHRRSHREAKSTKLSAAAGDLCELRGGSGFVRRQTEWKGNVWGLYSAERMAPQVGLPPSFGSMTANTDAVLRMPHGHVAAQRALHKSRTSGEADFQEHRVVSFN